MLKIIRLGLRPVDNDSTARTIYLFSLLIFAALFRKSNLTSGMVYPAFLQVAFLCLLFLQIFFNHQVLWFLLVLLTSDLISRYFPSWLPQLMSTQEATNIEHLICLTSLLLLFILLAPVPLFYRRSSMHSLKEQ